MNSSKYLILGGGMVAGYAAKEFVSRGLKAGDLTIVSSDDALPYERPPLSKSFLAGKDDETSILINPEPFYGEHGITVRLRTEITGVDLKSRRLRSRNGEEFTGEHLALATGARVRTLDTPGHELQGIFYLRSMRDSKSIRNHAANAKRAVVIGSGFIGMEVASVLAQKNIETTMVLREDRIWKSFFTPEMSAFFEKYYADRGVHLIKATTVNAFGGDRGIQSATLANGDKLTCDMAVAGIGVQPVTDLLADTGIIIDNGIAVNEYLETNQPNVYAAGDAANYNDTLFGKRRRVEHWDNAVSQGQYLARTLSGDRQPFVHVPYFFSDVFDLSFEFWGDPAGATETIHRGDMTTSSFSVWWLKGSQLVAAFVMNRPDAERESAPQWIEKRQRPDFLSPR